MFYEPRPRVLEGSESNPFRVEEETSTTSQKHQQRPLTKIITPSVPRENGLRDFHQLHKANRMEEPKASVAEEASRCKQQPAAAAGGGSKPALPPKPERPVPPSLHQQQVPPPDSFKEEKDRDSEPPPEGSVDLSPTYSESVQSGAGGTGRVSGTTTAGTPAYVRWAESVHQLLDDRDGVELFEKYLKQQGLDHLLLFYLACKGFKNTVQQNADSQDNSGDEEGHRAQAKAQELLMAGAINKRYVNSSRKNLATKIEFIDDEARKSVDRKISVAKAAAAAGGAGPTNFDTNIFDGVQQEVLEHLEAKCYPNFLKSDVYIDHVQACQALALMSTLSTAESAGSSRTGGHSGTQSSASSVSARDRVSSAGGHSLAGTNRQDDSGISGISGSDPKSSSAVAPDTKSSEHPSSSVIQPSIAQPSIAVQPSQPAVTAAAIVPSAATAPAVPLPTVDEDKELKILMSDTTHGSNSSLASRGLAGKGQPQLLHKPEFVNPGAVSGVRAKSGRPFNPSETHPGLSGNGSGSATGSTPHITSASYAYHASSTHAYQSNWNPVSRQDSEIQSQSSGAVGDTTDDNYSSFTDPSPAPAAHQPQPFHHGLPSGHSRSSRGQSSQMSKWERHRERKMEKKKIEESSQRNKDLTSQIIPRPRTNQAVPPSSQTPQNPEEFARILTAKLQAVIEERAKGEKERAKQKRLTEKLNQIDADSSVASFPASAAAKNIILNRSSLNKRGGDPDPNDPESDQSILDDHFNRVFVDTPPVARSPPTSHQSKMKSMSQSFDNMRMGGGGGSHHTRTLPSRRQHQQANNTLQSNNSSLIQHHNFGPVSGYRSANTSGFAGGGGGNFAGDLAYFPSGAVGGNGKRSGHAGAAAYSDVDFGAPAAGQPPTGTGQFQQSRQPMAYNTQTKERVSDWVQNVSSSFAQYPQQADQLSESKTSSRHRARSQDRHAMNLRHQQQMGHHASHQYLASSGGGVGGSSSSNNNWQQSAAAAVGAAGQPVQPNLLEARLLQHQQTSAHHHQSQQASRINNNISLMAQPPQQTTGVSSNMNMSLPVGGSSGAGDAATEFTTAVYKFPQEREDMPYRVKIPGKFVTLRHVKEYMPKKGAFRYYFKTEIDSEVCFEEETDDRAQVPMFQNKMIIVQCRND